MIIVRASKNGNAFGENAEDKENTILNLIALSINYIL